MMGVAIGTEMYCEKCGKPLSQKDVDLFAYELRDESKKDT